MRSFNVFCSFVDGDADVFQSFFRIGDQQALLFVEVGELFPLQVVERSDTLGRKPRGIRSWNGSVLPVVAGTIRPSSVQPEVFAKVFRCVRKNVAFRRAGVSVRFVYRKCPFSDGIRSVK